MSNFLYSKPLQNRPRFRKLGPGRARKAESDRTETPMATIGSGRVHCQDGSAGGGWGTLLAEFRLLLEPGLKQSKQKANSTSLTVLIPLIA